MDVFDFANDLEKINFNSLFVEEQIKTFKYNQARSGTKNEYVENTLRLPSMIMPFYDYVFENQKIPEPEKYINELFPINYLSWIKQFDSEIQKGIKYRLWKSYPSFIRDLHFCLLLRDRASYFSKIIYNRKLDVEFGIDILINYKEINFGVKLYTYTENGLKFRNKKDRRHLQFDNIIGVELPINLDKCKTCGDIYLYSENEMELLNKNINNSISLQTIT